MKIIFNQGKRIDIDQKSDRSSKRVNKQFARNKRKNWVSWGNEL